MKTNNKKISVLTLGCAKNVVDSEELLKQIDQSKYKITKNSEKADVLVINTCGFIADAKKESIDAIIEAVNLKKQGKLKKIVVMGCLSERYRNELSKEIPEIDVYLGTNKIEQVISALNINYKYELIGERFLTTPHHYAYLKISEGCNHPCSFCAIPIMRGNYVSKPLERIIKEAEHLAMLGVKELIIIAQDTTYYGLDLYRKRCLSLLLRKLSKIEGIEWIRLMYAYPAKFSDEILDVIVDIEKVCKYIDIPLQHISDKILKSMRRGINSKETYKLIEKIRKKVSGITLRTTLIVGYPEETEKEFKELVNFVKDIQFDRLGVFTYSPEEDTLSYSLGNPIPDEIKNFRKDTLMKIQRDISYNRNKSLIGKEIKIIVDSKDFSTAIGRSESDAPEVDNEIIVIANKNIKIGNFYNVKIVNSYEYDLLAKFE